MRKFIVLLSILAFFTFCGKVNPTAPEDGILHVSANPGVIAAGGDTSIITVIGYKSTGIPLSNGTIIYFSTDIGSIDATAGTKDGIARANFISDERSGIAHIYVSSGKATVSPFPLEIAVGSSALSYLTIGAKPGVLPKGGGRSTITATAFDEAGNSLQRIPIIFSTDKGTMASGGKPLYTDKHGTAIDYLNTDKEAIITATSGVITVSVLVTIEINSPPSASFVFSPTDAYLNDIVYFNGSASSDNDGYITEFNWDFGDGFFDSGIKVSHVYNTEGAFQVSLTVIDNNGASGTTSQEITVTEKPNLFPNASFVFSPTSPAVNTKVFFNASVSSDSDGYITEYSWDFGDGTSGSGVQTSHIYTSTGTFHVTLVVKDDMGATSATSKTISISEENSF